MTEPFPAYDPSWSLSNEMVYYAAWPLALMVCARSGNRAARLSMMLSWLVVTIILVTWKVFHRLEASAAAEGMWAFAVLYPIWIAGAWLSINWTRMRERATKRAWLLFIPLCFLSLGILAIARYKGDISRGINVTGLTSIPGLLILMAGGHHLRLSQLRWAKPVCRWLGDFSYPCYVLHYQTMRLLDYYLLDNRAYGSAHHPVLRAVVLLVLTLAIVSAVGPPVERRIMAWRSRVLSKGKNQTGSARRNRAA